MRVRAVAQTNVANAANAAAAYKPGQATELLEQSLQKLKANDKDEFRSQAGKIISLMLENRLPAGGKVAAAAAAAADHTDNNTPFTSLPVLPIHPTQQPPPPLPVAPKSTAFSTKSLQRPAKPAPTAGGATSIHYKTVATKPIAPLPPLPPLAIGHETHFEETLPSPPPPPPPMHSPPPLTHAGTGDRNLHILDPHSLALVGMTLPSPPQSPPPPPPPPAQVTQVAGHNNPPHHSQHHHEAERAPVVLRQRAAATTGGAKSARDRRSFIDRDGGGSIYNALAVAGAARPSGGDRSPGTTEQPHVNGSSSSGTVDAMAKPTTAMAPKGHGDTATGKPTISDDGLWNGAPPVCCVCQTKIQR